MPATLRTATALYASALLLDRLLGLLLLPLLTRAIAPHDYGAWTQTAVTTGLLMPLVLLATPTAIVRSFSAAVGRSLRLRFFGRLGGVALALFLIVAALVLLWREPFARAVYGESGRAAIVPALLALLAADAAVDFATAWLRAAGRMGLIAAVLALRSVLRFAVLLWLVGAGGVALADWLGSYAAVQCVLALAVVAGTLAVLRRGAEAASTAASAAGVPTLRGLLAFCLPLVALALFTSFSATFDRFLLVQLLGLEAVAVYAAAVSLSGVPALFYTVLGFTLFPVLARHWSDGRRDEAARLSTQALLAFAFLCLPVALALALAGPALLPLLSTADYRAELAVFALLGLSVAAFGLYQILLYTLLLDGRSRQVLALAVAAAALNAALNLLLAPRWGTVGAAAAAAASNAAMVVWAARLAERVMPWRFPWRGLGHIAWRALAAALPLAAVLWPWRAAAQTSWPLVSGAVLLGALLYLALDWSRAGSVARMLLAR
ncbi:MAG: lipopolysaccharide biosynthesis protein [Rubrivivax sp.]|nr:lipopolysaccharide biosynthesis protein [Rubrivivax sp.]